jgi:hypothetical protein
MLLISILVYHSSDTDSYEDGYIIQQHDRKLTWENLLLRGGDMFSTKE